MKIISVCVCVPVFVRVRAYHGMPQWRSEAPVEVRGGVSFLRSWD